jgi:hypothetical protein
MKKGDPELVALVIQLYDTVKEKVFAATLNKGLLKALTAFIENVKYEIIEKAESIYAWLLRLRETRELKPPESSRNYPL